MNTYARELEVRQRIQERLHEAEGERLARLASGRRRPDTERRTWRGRFAMAIVRRLTGAAGAA